MITAENICRDIFLENRDSIKIKKEKVVVKNLVNIFNATLRLSNEKGFHAMSLRDLCQETGLSMGALYSYFSSKDDLLETIQEQGRRLAVKVLTEYIEKAGNPEEKLEAAVKSHLYLSEIMQDWFFFSYMETRYLDKEEHKKAIAGELYTEQLFIDILEQGKAQKKFKVDNAALTAAVIKAMLQDWYLKRWKYSRRVVSVEEYAEFLIGFIRSYIIPD
ncbi:MAG: TetR family transcriptional regulator [Deltaproteobacteria bacterium]|nr:TetR family transcriptional regulator [Deltaproteobacteria bacterium]